MTRCSCPRARRALGTGTSTIPSHSLSVALEQAPELDEERVAILGLSRGGGVGLLTAARDKRIKAVVEFFGPTDLFGEYALEIFEEALEGELRDLPGLDYMNENVIVPWKEGALSNAAARLELVRRSAVYFVGDLPPVQPSPWARGCSRGRQPGLPVDRGDGCGAKDGKGI